MLRLAGCLGTHKGRHDTLSKPTHHDEAGAQPGTSDVSIDHPLSPVAPRPPQITDEHKSRKEVRDEIIKQLQGVDVNKVVLVGPQGVGKTWLAKEVTSCAIINDIVHVTIWVYPGRCYKKPSAMYKSIAHQLALQLDPAGADCYLHDDDENEPEVLNFCREKLKGKNYLLVLDDVEDPEMHEVTIRGATSQDPHKVLITRTCDNYRDAVIGSDSSEGTLVVKVKPLAENESVDLLRTKAPGIPEDTLERIAKQFMFLPAALAFTATALGYVFKNETEKLNRTLAVQEATKEGVNYWTLGCCSGYETFRSSITIRRCFYLSWIYLEEHGSVHYNELISYWILEGYFHEYTSLEKAYAEGHSHLMDLFEAGLLGEREGGDVVLEKAGSYFANYLFPSLCEETKLGYSPTFMKMNGLGNVKITKDKIAAFKRTGQGENDNVNLSSLIVDGSSFLEAEQERLFESSINTLQVLSVFHAGLKISSASMNMIAVVILKNSQALTASSIHSIAALRTLTALEVSECSSLVNIPQDFLANFPDLLTLNLSGLPIESFPRPTSPTALSQLRSLILRGCTELKTFPEVNNLGELEELDISGANKLSSVKFTSFKGLPKLKSLNLSETKIVGLPGLDELGNLSHLSVKSCTQLIKLQRMTTLTRLQVIDASDSIKLLRFQPFCLPSGGCLRKLDLSGSKIPDIPEIQDASNLLYLCCRNCRNLKSLPAIKGAANLRVLDVSGAIQLAEIHTEFAEMKSLQELHLSEAQIQNLHPLSHLQELRKVSLSGCSSLQELPEMVSLINLQVLDLSGCTLLKTLPDEPFRHMNSLEKLDLSDTCFASLPESITKFDSSKVIYTTNVHVQQGVIIKCKSDQLEKGGVSSDTILITGKEGKSGTLGHLQES